MNNNYAIDPKNILLLTDSYKVSHAHQYPKDTEVVYSYFESRGGDFPEVTFFGLQYFIQEYLEGEVVTLERIEQAQKILKAHFGPGFKFPLSRWLYILHEHDGKLPVKIKAVKEGTAVPTHNVMLTIENTDPKCWWLTNYLETLLVQVWYPSTVASNSKACRDIILKYLEKTGDPSLIDFKLHDFGYRGSTSVESAAIGGCAHLVSFLGTDTLAATIMAHNHYDCKMAGFSIPASEHSTITSWGRENEVDAFKNMLDLYPTGLVACVSDSFDIYKACSELWGKELRDQILNRDGTLVVRPDSGDPVTVLLKCLELLGNAFGYTTNEKGYKVLDPHVRIIQGDGIDREAIEDILDALEYHGWSADNLAFGSGGGLLQRFDRDTSKYAFKCSWIQVNGEGRDVYKDPVTSKGKKSKPGRLTLLFDPYRGYFTAPEAAGGKGFDCLETVFEDGVLLRTQSLDEIRAISRES